MRRLLLTTALIFPLPAFAQDTALLLGNERYEQLDRVTRADNLLEATESLEELGFTVFARANGRVVAAKDLAAAFQASAVGAERLVVALSGHFVTDGTRTWLLTAEAVNPDLFSVDDSGLSIESLLHILASRPGQAVLLLGVADPDDLELDGSGLIAGVGEFVVPQGVTVIQSAPTTAANVLSGPLSLPEEVLGRRFATNPNLVVEGYLPMDWTLMPSAVILDNVRAPVGPSEAELNAEAALWDRATSDDTVQAYRAYVARYPTGRFVDDAEAQIAAILAEPNRDARLAEEALSLSRSDRRTVQSNLTLLNYNTRGVDGIFGPGSRGAITNWQQSNGFPQTSYLTRDQINLLDAQAARRRAEIEADEARALAEAEALERAYWAETGARGDEAGFRAYLGRYPNGIFAQIARAQLDEIERSRRTTAETADRAAWAIAQSADTPAAYQEYLALYPEGVFSDQARGRIATLSTVRLTPRQIEIARSEEDGLRLSGVRAQLLELRLRELGFNPGPLDGVIDDTTREAIKSYQSRNGVPVTGYVDRQTAVRLMNGSITFTVPGR